MAATYYIFLFVSIIAVGDRIEEKNGNESRAPARHKVKKTLFEVDVGRETLVGP